MESRFAALASFQGVNIPPMARFTSSTQRHLTQSCKEIHGASACGTYFYHAEGNDLRSQTMVAHSKIIKKRCIVHVYYLCV